MPPSILKKMLWILIFSSLPLTSVAADEDATAADRAELASCQQKLQVEFDERMGAWIDSVIEVEMGQVLAARTTDRLQEQILPATRPDDAPPPAMRASTEDLATTRVQPMNDTACTMVGQTLECVVRDRSSRWLEPPAESMPD